MVPPPSQQEQQTLGIQLQDQEPINTGGYKQVWNATLLHNGLPCICTGERTSPSADTELASLQRLASLPPHPNVVALLNRLDANGCRYLVQTVAGVEEVFDQIMNAGGGIGEPRALAIFSHMVCGLRHMHRCGVAHRDIKLENAMVAADGSCRLIDFGLSLVVPESAPPQPPIMAADFTTVGRFGTQSYIPPEMMNDIMYDARLADVWSLGICLFSLVAGFFPFDQALIADFRFQLAVQTQNQGGSTVTALYALYNLPIPMSPSLIVLLDGMLTINAGARLTLDDVTASEWLIPASAVATAHGQVRLISPGRLRAIDHWRILRRAAAIRSIINYWDSLTGHLWEPGGVRAQENMEEAMADLAGGMVEVVVEEEELMTYRCLSASAPPCDVEALVAVMLTQLDERPKPPPLERQKAQYGHAMGAAES
jgi:serine/threonine protein kinase